MMSYAHRLRLVGLLSLFASSALAASPKFEFQNHDRVVMLGGTFVEREGNLGYLETALTSATPRRLVTFRNLGWSGDTVWADSRGIFDPPQVGYQRMLGLVKELKPTVVFLAYGANESFAGEAGLKPFVEQYEKLIDDLNAVALSVPEPKELRYVFLTPHQWETPAPPLPDAGRQNPMLGRYAQAIRELAERRGGRLIDLYERTAPATRKGTPVPAAIGSHPPRGFQFVNGVWKSLPLTENGIHLSKYGYLRVSRIMLQELKLPHAEFLLQLDSEGEADADTQMTVSDFHSDGMQVRFQALLSRLPEPPTPLFPQDVEFFMVAGGGLPSGKYALKIDGQIAAVNPTLLVGFPVRTGPDYEQAEQLRKKIVAKNQQFSLRWRPLSIAYLTVLRDHMHGNDAAEIAQFDPRVEKLELEIAELKKPVKRKYQIVPRTEEGQK